MVKMEYTSIHLLLESKRGLLYTSKVNNVLEREGVAQNETNKKNTNESFYA